MLVYINQQFCWSSVLLLAHALLNYVVTLHQRVGNGTFMFIPFNGKNVHHLLAIK